LLPEEVDEEDDDEVIVWSDQTAEQWDVLEIIFNSYNSCETEKIDFMSGVWLLLAVDVWSVHEFKSIMFDCLIVNFYIKTERCYFGLV
jgi:hypothetical protein